MGGVGRVKGRLGDERKNYRKSGLAFQRGARIKGGVPRWPTEHLPDAGQTLAAWCSQAHLPLSRLITQWSQESSEAKTPGLPLLSPSSSQMGHRGLQRVLAQDTKPVSGRAEI